MFCGSSDTADTSTVGRHGSRNIDACNDPDQPDKEDQDQDRDHTGCDDDHGKGLDKSVQDVCCPVGQTLFGLRQLLHDLGNDILIAAGSGDRCCIIGEVFRRIDGLVDGLLIGLIDHIRYLDAGRDDHIQDQSNSNEFDAHLFQQGGPFIEGHGQHEAGDGDQDPESCRPQDGQQVFF